MFTVKENYCIYKLVTFLRLHLQPKGVGDQCELNHLSDQVVGLNQGSVPGKGRIFFASPHYLDRLRGPTQSPLQRI
jgi:hypothetical protein